MLDCKEQVKAFDSMIEESLDFQYVQPDIDDIMSVSDSTLEQVLDVSTPLKRQRGKGKKPSAVLVSIRIPVDVLSMIDSKADFMGESRTDFILRTLKAGF